MAIELNIQKQYSSFSLSLEFSSDAKKIGILGASGSGKSLTLKCLAGIEQPDSGRITVNNTILYDSAKKICQKPQVRKIGYLFQNYALFPTMTVEENISVGLKGKRTEKREKVQEFLQRFQLVGMEKRLPSQLSGGQQQRVALARILAYEPDVILLDEPFSALDSSLRDTMQQQLSELLSDYSGIVILVSHNREEIYQMSEELLILDEGKPVAKGPTKAIFDNPKSSAAARLTGWKNIGIVQPESSLFIPSWNFNLYPQKVIPSGVTGIAIRAHAFTLTPPKEEPFLCFPVYDPVITEEIGQYRIFFSPSPDAVEKLEAEIPKSLWTAKREDFPAAFYLKENDLLFLYE